MNLRLGASLVESSGKSVTRRLRPILAILRNRKAAFGAAVLLIFVLIALLAPLLAPGDPNQFVGRPRQAPSAAFPLGTTGQGQDVLKQMIWGTRTSVTIGIIAGLATTALGVGIGMAAGYFGGFADELISLVINIFLVVPGLPLLVTLAAFLPSGPGTIVFVLAFTGWAWPARVLRSLTLSLREKDFVFAAVVAGESSARIILVEILPNMMSIVAATFFNAVIYAIVAEAGLEFLGLGDFGVVSWGTILYWASNNAALLTGAWWTFVPPGLSIALVAFSLTMVNYAIDEITNPRLRAQKEMENALRKSRLFRHERSTPVIREQEVGFPTP